MIVTRPLVALAVGAAFLLPAATAAGAGTDYWNVTSGTWSVSSNWSTMALPGTADSAYFINGGTAGVTQSGAACAYLYLGGSGTSSVAVSGTGTLSAGYEYLGYIGPGGLVQSGGTNTVGAQLSLGNSASAPGTYTLSAGLLSAAGENEYVGYSGSGAFNQSGGTNIVGALSIGYSAAATYSLGGSGLLWANDEYVGPSSAGTLNQSGGANSAAYVSVGGQGRCVLAGGTLQVDGFANQGVLDGSGGAGLLLGASGSIVDLSQGSIVNAASLSLTVNANSLLIVPKNFNSAAFRSYSASNLALTHTAGSTLTVAAGQGFSGIGAVADHVSCQGTISATAGGWINLNGGVSVAASGSAAGSVNLGSGNFVVNDTLSGISAGTLSAATGYVGYSGTGSFAQSGGACALANVLVLAAAASDSGAYTLSGAAALSAPNEQVALGGSGSFAQQGGSNRISNSLYLGEEAGASGAYSLNGGTLVATTQYVGWSGSGAFNQTGGSNSAVSALYVGFNSGGSGGTYTLGNSGILNVANEFIGFACPGTFTQSGGTNTAGGLLILGNISTGTYNLTGGALVLAGIASSRNAHFNLGGGTLRASTTFTTSQPLTLTGSGGNVNIDTAGYAVTLAGSLAGPGGLYKLGGGTLTLSASNSYAGGTTVAAGTLALGSSAGLPAGSGATVNGTLDLGTHSASVGALYGAGIVNHSGTGSSTLSVVGGVFYGTIENTGGTLALLVGGGSDLVLGGSDSFRGGTTVAAGTLELTNVHALVDGANVIVGRAAAFSTIVAEGLGPGAAASPASSAVPEPGTLALAAAGVLGACFRRLSAVRRRMMRAIFGHTCGR